MRRAGLVIMTVVILALGASLALAADRLAVVTAAKANVRSGPGTSHPQVAVVERGDELTVLEESGNWLRVRLPREGEGWVYNELVELKKAPVSSGGGFLDTLKKGFTASRSSEMTAAAGSRGLGEEEGGGGAAADYDAVSRMEKQAVGAEQVRAFARDGGLKPEKLP